MPDWTPDELAAIGGAGEIQITTLRRDGTTRPYKPIWVVRCGDTLVVRSYRGTDGDWYRHAQQYPHGRIKVRGVEHAVDFAEAEVSNDVVDQAYRDKYGSNGYVDTIVSAGVAATTMSLAPRSK